MDSKQRKVRGHHPSQVYLIEHPLRVYHRNEEG
jgi:hypothetical protein